MSSANLEIRPAGAETSQLGAYSRLLGAVFGAAAKFSPQAIAWRYRDNPAGRVVGADAWAGETLAAHYVACPLTARVGARSLRGLLSLNTATHPDFQGRGLFTQLACATYDQAHAAGYDFIVGVANANSTPGFVRKLSFQKVAPLAAGLLLGAPRRFGPQPVTFQVEWGPEQIAWRLANPAARYAVSRHRGLTIASAATHLPGVRCVALLDPEVEVAATRPAPGAGLFIGLEPRLGLALPGFIALPDRLRPSPLNLIYRPLSEAAPAELDPAATRISFLDFDPY